VRAITSPITDMAFDIDATCRAECFSPGSDTIGT
jgi:hypothetical protein